MTKFLLISIICLLSFGSFSQCTTAGTSLATLYNSDNSNKGVMFNLVATSTITLLCFDVNMIGFSTGVFEVYYKTGSYVGSESNAAAWTMLGSNTVTALGNNNPTPLNIPLNLVIPAGQTYGFYITNNNPGIPAGVRYTNGAVATLASNANVSIQGGIGKSYPFDMDYANRRFNGTVHYVLGNVLPVELVSFHATSLSDQVKLSWETQTENNNDYFTIERSQDGAEWVPIHTIKGMGTSANATSYLTYDNQPLYGISYYRLKQTDFNGHTAVFETSSVERNPNNSHPLQLHLFPNPAGPTITVTGTGESIAALQIFDLTGRDLTSQVKQQSDAYGQVTLDISNLPAVPLILRSEHSSALILRQ